MKNVLRDSHHRASGPRAGCVIHEELLGDEHSILEGRSFSQPVPERADRMPDHSFRIPMGVGKLAAWNPEQVHEGGRRKEYSE